MGLREELLQSIRENDYNQPTPIQEQAIPRAMEGRDLICCAQTGTGKTAAFALPILNRLAAGPRANLRALILVPTRELAIQVGRNFIEYGKHLDLVSATAFGGTPIEPQEMMLRHGVDVLIATPGRLKDHVWRGNIDFRYTEILVLDEADRMLDMGFIKDIREIVELLPTKRQSMLFSATLGQDIRRFSRGILEDPLRIEVAPPASTLDEVDQYLVRTSRGQKRATLEGLIRSQRMTRTIIFARTKTGASQLARQLRERGHKATDIHSDRSQSERIQALEGFREGRIHLLIATDIAARGIDVRDVSHVVNYDLPYSAKDYVHRIGRTARAGRRGTAISLVTSDDSRDIAAIERLIARKLPWLDEREPRRGPTGNETTRPYRPSRDESPRRRRPTRNDVPRRRSTAGPNSRRDRRRTHRRETPVTVSEQKQPVETPARGNDKKGPGILKSITKRLRTGLFPANR